MSDSFTCPKCSSPVTESQADGLCPACLMKAAMGPAVEEGTIETLDRPRVFDAPTPEQLSAVIDSVHVEEILGYGGMGAVYRGRQKNLDRPVALKIIAPRLSDDPGFLERFTREAKTLARLNHPNIVTVFDFGQAEQYCYLVMELIEGVNLRDAIVSGGVSPDQALQIVPKVCDALQYAHSQGVVHRDIKPENILVGYQSEVKIADFGLAKMLDKRDVSFTLTGTQQVLGTRNYMAPEQIERPSTVDHRADIYSLGVVFYELLTGELPLGRFSLPSEKANVNGQLDDVVLRTLEKEPARRFQQASDVKTAVEALESPLPAGADEADNAEAYGKLPPVVNKPYAGKTAIGIHVNAATSKGYAFPSSLSMPFSNDQVHGGLSNIQGLAHLREGFLEFEFRVHRLGVAKSAKKVVQVPLEQISLCRLHSGMFAHSLELQSKLLETFEELPGSAQGRFTLEFEKRLKQQADEFHQNLQQALGVASEVEPTSLPQTHTVNPSQTALEQVTFKIGNIDYGESEAVGIAKVTATGLIIEYDVINVFGVKKKVPAHLRKRISQVFGGDVKARSAIVHIPFEQLMGIRFKPGIIGNKIEVQTDSLELVSDIPHSKQGKFEFKVPRNQTENVRAWARKAIQLGKLPLPGNLKEAKPLTNEQQLASVHSALKPPRWGLIAGVALNGLWLSFVAAIVVFCWSAKDEINMHLELVEREQLRVVEENPRNRYFSPHRIENSEIEALRRDQPSWMPLASELFYSSGVRTIPGSKSSAQRYYQFVSIVLVTIVGPFLAIIVGVLMLMGLLRVRLYWFLVTGAFLYLIPFHVGAIVTVPVGLWLLFTLLRPSVRAPFIHVQKR